ncbi:TPA: hypothetical protein ACX6SL_001317 [Photobacterium damselae]
MNTSSKTILELCESWCMSVQLPDGGIGIGGQSEQYRLLRNGIQFHELEYQSLKVATIGLSRVLLLRGLNTVIDQDHFALWSWCAELILNHDSNIFEHDEHELRKLFETCIRASLANCTKPTSSREEWEQQANRTQLIPHNAKYFVQEASLALAYLAFPLLEGICKKLCSAYIGMDGKVSQVFKVPSRNKGFKIYDPDGKWNQKQCSSLRDLLHLTSQLYPSSELEILKAHIQTLGDGSDAFDVIYRWRNESLHGTTSFQTIGGTLLSFAIFLLLNKLEQNFEQIRVKTLEHCRWNAQHENRSPWSYYPPY